MKLNSLPISIFVLLALVFASVLPAGAQQAGYSGWHRGWLRPGDRMNGMGFRGQMGGARGWRGQGQPYSAGTGYGGANPAALSMFDTRANQLRAEISARSAARAISPGQAYRLNQELNSLLSIRAQVTAGGGAIDQGALANLNARLVQLQMGLRSPISF